MAPRHELQTFFRSYLVSGHNSELTCLVLPVHYTAHLMETYKVEYNDGVQPPTVRDKAGHVIPLDECNAEFCAFLTWASKREKLPQPFDALPPGGSYFATVEALLEHCKQYGVTLHVTHDFNSRAEFGSTGVQIPIVGRELNFSHIERSVAFPDESGYTATDGIIGEFSPIDVTNSRHGAVAPIHVSNTLLAELNEKLQEEDSDVRRVSSWTVERTFVYIDVSDFSTIPPGRQVLVINSLIECSAACVRRSPPKVNRPEASLCIGDGYIYVFKTASAATRFAAALAHEIETRVAKKSVPVEFHFRIGAHVGHVFRFWDPGRKDWNYIGDGINGGNRVLTAMGKDTDDVVFVSSAVRERLIADEMMTPNDRLLRMAMRNRGRHTDKQGKRWRIYELHVATVYPL